ncbi:MAG: histidine kinase [Dinghuibacter sp.]|nr:histidine kinase [Dinghuibacter sp.]
MLIWLIYYGIISLGLFINGNFTSAKDIGYNYLGNVPYILAFYFIYYLVFGKPGPKKHWTSSLWIGVIFPVVYLLNRYINNHWMPYTGDHFPLLSRVLLADSLINFLQHFLYAFLYWQFVKRVYTERKLRLSETEKLKTEYSYLKSQINPHFLYNTLDYFYAWMLKHDRKQADGLAILGQLMRYSLAVGESDGKVKLRDEAEQVEHYIQLQQLRFENKLNIIFDCPEIPCNLLIVPHLLITLVENAFKYGVTNDAEHPVHFQLLINEKEILFSAKNKVSHLEQDKTSTGIGLQNLAKRLVIEYPGKHDYSVERNAEQYKAILKLVL